MQLLRTNDHTSNAVCHFIRFLIVMLVTEVLVLQSPLEGLSHAVLRREHGERSGKCLLEPGLCVTPATMPLIDLTDGDEIPDRTLVHVVELFRLLCDASKTCSEMFRCSWT